MYRSPAKLPTMSRVGALVCEVRSRLAEALDRQLRRSEVAMLRRTAAARALLLLAPISCATVLAEDFGQSGDHWRIWVDEVRTSRWGSLDGYATGGCSDYSDSWSASGTYESSCIPDTYNASSDRGYLYVVLTIRNLSAEPRTFDLAAVRLGGGEVEENPSILDMNWGINIEVNPQPELDPGEEITRLLIFDFPEHLDPDHLSVGGLTLAFPDSRE